MMGRRAQLSLLGLLLLTVAGCARLGPWPMADGWRVGEGFWARSGVPTAPTFTHADPFMKAGLLGRPGEWFTRVSLASTLEITSHTQPVEQYWAALIVAGHAPLALGAWGGNCLVQVSGDGLLRVIDTRDSHAGGGPVQLKMPPARAPLRLRVEASGTSMTVYVNGFPALDYQTSRPLCGEVALANSGCTARFGEVVVRGARQPRPRVNEKRKEKAGAAQPTLSIAMNAAPGLAPLPRIAAQRRPGQPGVLINTAIGQVWHPVGFNYTHIGAWWHATFNVGRYDGAEAERALEAMRAAGANCVRVWAWGEQNDGTGNAGTAQSCGQNAEYIANFVDFLRRATRHGIYVIAILDECPLNAGYRELLDATRSNDPAFFITGHNRQFLAREWIVVKARQAQDFIAAVKAADPALLSTVLAWEFANEAFANTTEGPFLEQTGAVRLANGRRYEMADFNERQACWDDGITYYARELTRAVRQVDPQALTTLGMWTADAHQRAPVNGLLPDARDPRVPPRPSALARRISRLALLDLHCYNWGDQAFLNPATHEAAAVRANGMPVVAGEFGVFELPSIDQPKARRLAAQLLSAIHDCGYAGALYWSWNLCEHSGTWCWQRLGDRLTLPWPANPIP
jgi:hypothetical protein